MVQIFLSLFELSFATLKRDASLKFETSNNSAQVILCEKDLRERKSERVSLLFVPSHSQTRSDQDDMQVRPGVGQAGIHPGQTDFSPTVSSV